MNVAAGYYTSPSSLGRPSAVERNFVDPVEPPGGEQELGLRHPAEARPDLVAFELPLHGEAVRRGPLVGEGGLPGRIVELGQRHRLVGLVELEPVTPPEVARELHRERAWTIEDQAAPLQRLRSRRRARLAVDLERLDVPDAAQR